MFGGRERIERYREMERNEELTVMCKGGGDELGSGKGSKEEKEEERKKERTKRRPRSRRSREQMTDLPVTD